MTPQEILEYFQNAAKLATDQGVKLKRVAVDPMTYRILQAACGDKTPSEVLGYEVTIKEESSEGAA